MAPKGKGGALVALSFGGRELTFTTNNEPTFKVGGFEVTIEMNGDGSHRELFENKPWELSGCELNMDVSNDDLEALTEFQKTGGDIGISCPHGVEYVANGNIIGEIESNFKKSTLSLSVSGGGQAKKL